MKICRLCKLPKSLDEFGNNSRYADGKHWACRACWTAYVQAKRYAKGVKPHVPFLNRLWDNIQQCGHEDLCPFCCWPWMKGCDEDGYGLMSVNVPGHHRNARVTRIVFEVWHGIQLPPDKQACHYCDNPPCCNPSHLWPGTVIDNRMDCVVKQRHARGDSTGRRLHPEAFPTGEAHPKAKLTAAEVLEIRELYASGIGCWRLSNMFGVSKFNIQSIIHRKTWKSL